MAPRPSPTDLAAATGRRVPDVLAPGLRVLFCGINPGLWSAAVGHHFARPGNRFWKALHLAGFTDRLLAPDEEPELLRLGLGITNLVDRATATAADLTPEELRAGARRRQAARRKDRAGPPRGGRRPRRRRLPDGVHQSHRDRRPSTHPDRRHPAWVLPNPSGLNAHYQLPDLAEAFANLSRSLD